MTLPPHIDGLQMLHPSDDDKLDDLRAHYCDVCGYIKPDAVLNVSSMAQVCACPRCDVCGLLLDDGQCSKHPTCRDCGGFILSDDSPGWGMCDCDKEHGSVHEPGRMNR